MRFILVERIGEKKVATIPEPYRWSLDRRAQRSNGRMQLVTLPIKTLVDDNNLLNDTSMACRRDFIWGEDPKNYHYKDHLANWTSNPITVKKVYGKYRITDGHHRVMALYNDGYDEVEVVLEESNNMNEGASAETDSEGNPLSPEQVAFFKDSVIRDENGRLLVCYHASDAEFDEFSVSKQRPSAFGYGFYFSTEEGDAEEYGGIVRPFYLNAKNLFQIGDVEQGMEVVKALEGQGIHLYDLRSEDKIRRSVGENIYDTYYFAFNKSKRFDRAIDNAIKSLGYDGKQSWSTEFIMFDPNQIKSITNKNPTSSNNINEEK